jgi:tripartite-type tricarboxylate transporter receptor subunit TctC
MAVIFVAATDPTSAAISYGVAAPVVGIMYAMMRKATADADVRVAAAEARADKSETRAEELTERLITQQAASLPLLTEAAAVIRATAPR